MNYKEHEPNKLLKELYLKKRSIFKDLFMIIVCVLKCLEFEFEKKMLLEQKKK